MADSAVSYAIKKLDSLLIEKPAWLKGIQKEVEGIFNQLKSIEPFIRYANAMAEEEGTDEELKSLVRRGWEKAYLTEDVIDEYNMVQSREQHGCRALFSKSNTLQKLSSRIQGIRESLDEIQQASKKYPFYSLELGGSSTDITASSEWRDLATVSLFLQKDNRPVGIQAAKDELIRKLLEVALTRMVVSLVGMRGIGKTTLAMAVYEDERVKTHFDCHAWVTVSGLHDTEGLLRSTIKQFCQSTVEAVPLDIDMMDETLLVGELRGYLRQKRYLVVFDDISRPDFCKSLERALPDDNNGSRIMITTRSAEDITLRNSHIQSMKSLPLPAAMDLFLQKAFHYKRHGLCFPFHIKYFYDVVKRCDGLPLAVVFIGGLLSTKLFDWKFVCECLSLELERTHLPSIKKILALNYNDLPYQLRTCFLYFGMLPEEYSISCSRLIRLWIAKGFIEEKQGITLEAVAEKYLTEFIYRGLVQVVKVSLDGRVKTCRVHDFSHEVFLSRPGNLSFNHVSAKKFLSLNRNARHISVGSGEDKVDIDSQLQHGDIQTRSIMFFQAHRLRNSFNKSFIAKFKLLSVLDFEGAHLHYIPDELGNLLLLSYVSIRNTKVKALPTSIAKLKHLETLDLRETCVSKLPVEINNFLKLRYFLAFFLSLHSEYIMNRRGGMEIQGSVQSLKFLQKLYVLDVEHANIALIESLGRLTQLRKLGIINLKKEYGMAFCRALEGMSNLNSLSVSSTNMKEILDLQTISCPPPKLQHICLEGPLEKMPDWIGKLKNLVRLSMNWSRLKNDPLKVLQTLPNLLYLRLCDAYDGAELHFRQGSFLKLKWLAIKCMPVLNKLMIEQGALVALESLSIGPTPILKEMPSGINHMTSLKCLEFFDMPREFAQRICRDPSKVLPGLNQAHVPVVCFNYHVQGARYRRYKLGDSRLSEFLQLAP